MAFLAVPGQGSADDLAKGAEGFISSLSEKAISALTVGDVDRPERVKRFRVLLHEHFDVKTIGRWVLGRYWRRASNQEKAEYLALFEDLIIATYVDRFTKYSGEKLTITKSISKGERDAVVFSKIDLPQSKTPLSVDWRVRAKSGKYKIIDVMVEGVSMGQTQRSEFASVISKNGGHVQGLLNELRKRLNKKA